MRKPDVMVTVEGGVAQVDVYKPGILVEVRDFDVEDVDEGDEFIWTNEEGDKCRRYFVDGNDPDAPPGPLDGALPEANDDTSSDA